MSHIPQEQFEEALRALPQEVKDVIFSKNIQDLTRGFIEKYKLHVDKVEVLTRGILATITALQSGFSLKEMIMRDLDLKAQEASALYADVLKHILLPVQNAFREAQEKERVEMERKQAEEAGDDAYEPEQAFVPAPPSDEHSLDNAPLGVLENNGMRERAAEPRAERASARLETESVAHVVEEEKMSITERKLRDAIVSLPLASTNVNIAAEKTGGAAAEPPRLDRNTYHGQDPYREPVDERG